MRRLPNLFGGRSVVLLYSEAVLAELKLPERIRRTSERRAPAEIAGVKAAGTSHETFTFRWRRMSGKWDFGQE